MESVGAAFIVSGVLAMPALALAVTSRSFDRDDPEPPS